MTTENQKTLDKWSILLQDFQEEQIHNPAADLTKNLYSRRLTLKLQATDPASDGLHVQNQPIRNIA